MSQAKIRVQRAAGFLVLCMLVSCTKGLNEYVPAREDVVNTHLELEIKGARFQGYWGDMDYNANLFAFQSNDGSTNLLGILLTNMSRAGWTITETTNQVIRAYKTTTNDNKRSITEARIALTHDTRHPSIVVGMIDRIVDIKFDSLETSPYGKWLNRELWPRFESVVKEQNRL